MTVTINGHAVEAEEVGFGVGALAALVGLCGLGWQACAIAVGAAVVAASLHSMRRKWAHSQVTSGAEAAE